MTTTYPISEAYADGQVLTAANVNQIAGGVNDLSAVQLNAQTGTTYTLVLADRSKTVTLTNASAITLTIPTNASVAMAVGSQVLLYQGGAGQVTIAGAGGVTVRSQGSKLKIAGQYGVAGLIKIATDEWVAFGNLTA
jgi:hypothetical protein